MEVSLYIGQKRTLCKTESRKTLRDFPTKSRSAKNRWWLALTCRDATVIVHASGRCTLLSDVGEKAPHWTTVRVGADPCHWSAGDRGDEEGRRSRMSGTAEAKSESINAHLVVSAADTAVGTHEGGKDQAPASPTLGVSSGRPPPANSSNVPRLSCVTCVHAFDETWHTRTARITKDAAASLRLPRRSRTVIEEGRQKVRHRGKNKRFHFLHR